MSWLNLGQEAQRWGTEHPSIVPYEAFQTKDSYLVIGAVNNRQFSKLCSLLGDASLSTDDRFKDNDARVKNRADLKLLFDGYFAQKTTSEWLAAFAGSGMPYGPINNMQQVFSHPQTIARNMIETLAYDNASSGELKVIGVPVKFSEQQPSIRLVPPTLGQHTDDVLEEIGISGEEVTQLREQGVV